MKQPQIYASALAELAAQYPFSMEVLAAGNVAEVRINGAIYQWKHSTSSSGIAEQIKAVKKKGITKAKLYLNTPGGSVFEANEIINLLDDNFQKVVVIGGALIASAGTYFMARYHTTIRSNTQVMIHKPKSCICGNEDQVESDLQLLKNVTADYKTAYANKTGATEEAIEQLWAKDYWMTAKKAKKMKLADVVLSEPAAVDASLSGMIAACGAPKVPKTTSKQHKNKNKNNMEHLIAQLGLPADATEAQVQAAVKALQDKAAEVEALKTEAANKEKAAKTAKIKSLLDQAEKDKKIEATQRDHYQALAESNFESTEAIIEAMNPITKAPSANLDTNSGVKADRKNWSYEDYQEKDPKGFLELSDAEQQKLIDASFVDND